MIRIRDIKLNIKSKEDSLLEKIADVLMLKRIFKDPGSIDFSYEVLKVSIDARKKPEIFRIFTLQVLISKENEDIIRRYFAKYKGKKTSNDIIWDDMTEYTLPECGSELMDNNPVIVGSGPAGLFAALSLARRGFCPLVVERGECIEDRSRTVSDFWEKGTFNSESNVQFGEGGAGTFSDGKLNTLTKDTFGRNTFVLKTFYEFGAPRAVTYDAKPHIGTDILKEVIVNIRNEIVRLGGQFMFCTKAVGFETIDDGDGKKICSVTLYNSKTDSYKTINTDVVVMAIGHSARDTFEMLYDKEIEMQQKSFAAGFRVIHPQSSVNEWAYGVKNPKSLGLYAADYKVTNETRDGIRVYSFCMCPGGYVVNASSEDNRCCVNGMSYSGRNGDYANSAVVVALNPDDFMQESVEDSHPLAGMYYQRKLEEETYFRGKGNIPVQRFDDFENGVATVDIHEESCFAKGCVCPADLRNIFSEKIDKAIIESMHKFGYTRKGFDDKNVLFMGTETRTSSPVRIVRDENFESNVKGIYPCGEGAGYAGGITSAAADGLKVAEQIISRYRFGR